MVEMTEQAKKRAAVYEMAKRRREAWNERFKQESEDGSESPPLLTVPESLTDNEVSMWYAILRLDEEGDRRLRPQERVHATSRDEERDLSEALEDAKERARAKWEDESREDEARAKEEAFQGLQASLDRDRRRPVCACVGHAWGPRLTEDVDASCLRCGASGVVVEEGYLTMLLQG